MADRLGMTVRRMRAEMDAREFLIWTRFHARKDQAEELAVKVGHA